MSEWNEPRPNTTGVNGFSSRERHVKLFKTKKLPLGYISTSTMVGTFPKALIPKNIEKIVESKILSLPLEPKLCKGCGAYMVLKKGATYTCINPKHTDVRVIKKIAKRDFDRRTNEKNTPILRRMNMKDLEKIIHA